MNKSYLILLGTLSFQVAAEQTAADPANPNLAEVLVTANRFTHKDTETTYLSEVHTAEEMGAAGVTTLYDFLAQKTSLNISSGFGNQATPLIDMRGFGLESGYQNVVITVDGQRLNNVDNSAQLLSAIPLNNVERIEITKGSGSVIYGDGATGGSIQIHTKHPQGVSLSGSGGSYGSNNQTISGGYSQQYVDISANVSRDSSDGYMQKDTSGTSNGFGTYTQSGKLKIKPTDKLNLGFEINNAVNNFTWENYLSRQQFASDPATFNPYSNYLKQRLDTTQYRLLGEYYLTDALVLHASHNIEEKASTYMSAYGNSGYNYDYQANDFSLQYDQEPYSAIVGYKDFDGTRLAPGSNSTVKNNKAFYINTEFKPTWLDNRLTFSAGGRQEYVHYGYNPLTSSAGTPLSSHTSLDAWDFGVNVKILNKLSVFSNFNQSFQTPDIDRFFIGLYDVNYNVIGQQFNGFIRPARVRTLNLGLNYEIAGNKIKASAFRANLHDEIFFTPYYMNGGSNTNIDQSHKYGFELQDFYKINDKLSASVIYTYTRALIDHSSQAAYSDGKQLPGVPKSVIAANLSYELYDGLVATLNQSYRSSSYAISNFTNNPGLKQPQYESTNLILNYKIKNYTLFGSINNLFEHHNALGVVDSSGHLAYYPVDFYRAWRLGAKVEF